MRNNDDSYNANYESMITRNSYLNTFDSNKIIIFGEIGELTKFNKQIHLKLPEIFK